LHIDYTKRITQCMAHVLAKAHTVKWITSFIDLFFKNIRVEIYFIY
jgi:hypothetical protein